MKANGFHLAVRILAAASGAVTYMSFLTFAFLVGVQTGDPPNITLALLQARVGRIGSIVAIVTLATSAVLFRSKGKEKIIAIVHACISGSMAVSMAMIFS